MFPESKGRFFLPKTMNRASARDRFVAHIIDMIVVSVVSSFIIGAFGSLGTIVSLVLYYLYFILAHKLFGVTVGKQAMGIFLASNESTGLTWQQVILREVFWKWVSGMLLMYGYLRIIFFQEALHDKWGKTTVVSEKKVEASFMKAALVTFTMVGIFCSSIYYCLTQTSLAGHILAKQLTEQGHVIRGLNGNPKKGWTVAYWKGQSPQGTYELFDVRFIYDFSKLYSSGILNIKEVHVSKAVYRMNEIPSFLKKEKNSNPLAKQADPVPQMESEAPLISKFVVDKINLGNIKIIRKGEDDIEVNRFYITSLSVDRNQASIGQAYIDAPFIQFQVWNSSVNFTSKTADIKSNFQLRKGLHRSIIKTISGKIEFRGDIQNPKLIKAEMFDRRVHINYASSIFYLKVRNFTPSQYLRYDTNVKNFTAEIKNNFCDGISCLAGGQARGQFYHNNKKFVFKGSDVWPDGQGDSRMKLQMTSLLMNSVTRSPIFSVSTEEDLKDFISGVYFAKEYVMLTPEEKMNIDGVSKDYFKYAHRSMSSEKGALPSREDFNR